MSVCRRPPASASPMQGAMAPGTLTSCLCLPQNEKENTSYDIDTLQDEEGDLLEFPGRAGHLVCAAGWGRAAEGTQGG